LDAVGAVTKQEYLRKSRYFLESAGYVDPGLMHHRSGPDFVVERERSEIKKGMQSFIRDATADPKACKVGDSEFHSRSERGSTEKR